MSIRPRFKFYLKEDEASWYKSENGVVVTTPIKTALAYDPIDWTQTNLNYVRHEIYKGVMRAYAAPVTFAEDGAFVVRNVFYTKGYNGRIIFEMELLDEAHGSQAYVNGFSGEVDMSGAAIDTDTSFQTAILDRGLIATIKAKQNVPYSIPILEDDCEFLLMDGVKLRNKSTFSGYAVMSGSATPVPRISPHIKFAGSEAPYNYDIGPERELNPNDTSDISQNSWFYKASYAGDVRLSYSGKVDAVIGGININDSFGHIQIMVRRGSSVQYYTLFQTGQFGGPIGAYTMNTPEKTPIVITFPVQPGDLVSIVIGTQPYGTTTNNSWYYNSSNIVITIEYALRNPSANVRCYRQIDLWNILLRNMTGWDTTYNVVSDYLTNPSLERWGNKPYNTMITSGNEARGIGNGEDDTLGRIQVDMSTMFEDLSNRDAIGIAVEGNNLRIEHLSYFYNNNIVALKLGLVSDFQIEVNKADLYNVLDIGYEFESNDVINGKDDPFTTFVYNVPVRYVDKEMKWISPFIASIYEWEYIRSTLAGKGTGTSLNTTTDKVDNHILLCEVEPTAVNGIYPPRRHQTEAGGSLQNLEAGETAYNLALMPEYNLRRKSGLVKGTMHLMTQPLRFQKADQNMKVISKLGTAYPEVIAKGDLLPADMESMITPPLFFNFKYPAPPEFDGLLFNGRNALIEFDWYNRYENTVITLRGFIEKVTVVNGQNEPSMWTLKPAPDTDFSKLIY